MWAYRDISVEHLSAAPVPINNSEEMYNGLGEESGARS